jgi:hypothetical protein
MTFIDTTYNKFQELIASKDADQPFLKNFAETAVKIHGELKSRLYQYLNPKSVELCSKLLHAIPMSLVLNTLTTPQIVVVSLISGACLWSCKKEFLSKDSKIHMLHSMAIVFFANIISYSTELSLGLLFRLPVNAALMAGSLFMADQLEGKVKMEPKKAEPATPPVFLEISNVQQLSKAVSDLAQATS